jgi:GNAT superfamily N-acetyltransferase
MAAHEEQRTGLAALTTATDLLQRSRAMHPTAEAYEAADLQWSWRTPRASDERPQSFWVDDAGRPEAAAIVVDEGGHVALIPIVLPDASPERVAQVVERALASLPRVAAGRPVEVEVRNDDAVLHEVLGAHGFALVGDCVVETWIDADDRPEISPLADGYRLATRAETADRPHHMTNAERNHPDVEARLRQTSLYRPDLDLVVHDAAGAVAAYGLFWHDPTTATGLVEPMRTEDAHQRRGLARHVLTAGVDRLARAGATRIKICFEPSNPASSHLYLSAGFTPHHRTVILRRG